MPCTRTLVSGTWPDPMEFYFVYILLSLKDGKFYIGSSGDVEQRFKDHNHGKNISTADRRLFELIYYEAFLSKKDALRREHYFKSTKGKVTLRQMLREYLNERKNL